MKNQKVIGSNPLQKFEEKQIKYFSLTDRFIPVDVYSHGASKCGGITDEEKRIYIPAARGNYSFEELQKSDKLHLIFIPEHRGGDYWALQPILHPTGVIGPMYGGNLAYSSDSRCERIYHIHDRFETQEAYDTLST